MRSASLLTILLCSMTLALADAGPFSDGLAPVCCDQERIRYINARGAWAFDLTLSRSADKASFIDGAALVELEPRSFAYIDRSGKVIARMRDSN